MQLLPALRMQIKIAEQQHSELHHYSCQETINCVFPHAVTLPSHSLAHLSETGVGRPIIVEMLYNEDIN